MARISAYTPIPFQSAADGYRQVFAVGDPIHVQAFGAEGEAVVLDACSGEAVRSFPLEPCGFGGLSLADISGLEAGGYLLEAAGQSSMPFFVTGDEAEIGSTVLVQYSMPDNRQTREAAFVVGGEQKFFSFRAKGGFKASDTEFSVYNEQFETTEGDIVELYAHEKTILTLSLGGTDGCPAYIGEALAMALSCQDLYIDGRRYSFAGGDIETMQVHDSADRFVYKAKLARPSVLDPAAELGMMSVLLRIADESIRRGGDELRIIEKI